MSRSVFVLFMETDRTPAIPFLYHSIILFPLSPPPPRPYHSNHLYVHIKAGPLSIFVIHQQSGLKNENEMAGIPGPFFSPNLNEQIKLAGSIKKVMS